MSNDIPSSSLIPPSSSSLPANPIHYYGEDMIKERRNFLEERRIAKKKRQDELIALIRSRLITTGRYDMKNANDDELEVIRRFKSEYVTVKTVYGGEIRFEHMSVKSSLVRQLQLDKTESDSSNSSNPNPDKPNSDEDLYDGHEIAKERLCHIEEENKIEINKISNDIRETLIRDGRYIVYSPGMLELDAAKRFQPPHCTIHIYQEGYIDKYDEFGTVLTISLNEVY